MFAALCCIAGTCDPISGIDASIKARLDQALSGLTAQVDHLSDVADAQRTHLAQDVGTLADTAVLNLQALMEQERQALDAVFAAGQNLSERATADLLATMSSLQTVAQQLTTALQSAVVDDIKRIAGEIDRQRTITLHQINATVQGILRPALAQLTASGDQLVGTIENTVATLILRIAGVAVFLAGAVGLLIALRRTTPGAGLRVGAVVIAAVLCVGGPVVVVFARPIGALGGRSVSIPSGDAVCARMMKSSAALAAAQAKPGAPRSAAPGAVVPLARRSLRTLMRAAPAAPVPGTADVKALATAALEDANQCITYATTAQMADLASQDFTRALAVVTDTVFCHAPGDCAVLGQGCALDLGVCLPFGVYCDGDEQCSAATTCSAHRCVARGHACTVAADCGVDDACDPQVGRCVALVEVARRHQTCTLPPPIFGPCAAGERRAVNRMVSCVQTVQPTPEVCDSMDNDCNGTIDDGLHLATHCIAAARGECANGTLTCTQGQQRCVPALPQVEVCDGKDNDCNGVVDDLPPRGACIAAATGECRNGEMRCRGGTWQCVSGNSQPEICDGKDNDCNGQSDENGVCPEESVFYLKNDERHGLFGLGEDHVWGGGCGTDAMGRARHRTRCSAHDSANRPQSHCEPKDTGFGPGWLSGTDTDCRCNVHYGTQADHHVRCEIQIFARPTGHP